MSNVFKRVKEDDNISDILGMGKELQAFPIMLSKKETSHLVRFIYSVLKEYYSSKSSVFERNPPLVTNIIQKICFDSGLWKKNMDETIKFVLDRFSDDPSVVEQHTDLVATSSDMVDKEIDKLSESVADAEKRAAVYEILHGLIDAIDIDTSDLRRMFKRVITYLEDFRFNDSSDFMLLKSLIIDEAILPKMQNKMYKDSDESATKRYSEICDVITKRIRETMKSLGITPEQRADKMKNATSNLAKLVAQYEETLLIYPEIEVIWQVEEIDMLFEKLYRKEITRDEFSILAPGFSVEKAKEFYFNNKSRYITHVARKSNEDIAKKVCDQIEQRLAEMGI